MDIEKQIQQDIAKLVAYKEKLEKQKSEQDRNKNLDSAKSLIKQEYQKPLTMRQKIKNYFHTDIETNNVNEFNDIPLSIEYIELYKKSILQVIHGKHLYIYEHDINIQNTQDKFGYEKSLSIYCKDFELYRKHWSMAGYKKKIISNDEFKNFVSQYCDIYFENKMQLENKKRNIDSIIQDFI